MVFSLEQIEKDFNELSQHIPFDQSCFQITQMANGKDSPHRQLRHHLLQIRKKLHALKTAQFARERLALDLEELTEQIESSSGFLKRKFEIDFREKTWQAEQQDKLIFDALIELSAHYNAAQNLPAIDSREQFEAQEKDYWAKRLVRESVQSFRATGAIPAGHIEILDDFGIVLNKTENGLALSEESKKLLGANNGEDS